MLRRIYCLELLPQGGASTSPKSLAYLDFRAFMQNAARLLFHHPTE
jgi:hypothetical protein